MDTVTIPTTPAPNACACGKGPEGTIVVVLAPADAPAVNARVCHDCFDATFPSDTEG